VSRGSAEYLLNELRLKTILKVSTKNLVDEAEAIIHKHDVRVAEIPAKKVPKVFKYKTMF